MKTCKGQLVLDWCIAPAIFLTLALCTAIVNAATITVEPPVVVSPLGGHFWLMGNTSAAPDDPLHLVTCGIRIVQNPLSWQGYLYASSDGGKTWWPSHTDATQADNGLPDQVSETSCAAGNHGLIAMSTSVWGRFYSRPFHLAVSRDGGQTWDVPVTRRGWTDAARMGIDSSSTRFPNRMYVFSNRQSETSGETAATKTPFEPLLTSADFGKTLFPAKVHAHGPYADPAWPTQVIILRDGTALAIYRVVYRAPAYTDMRGGVRHLGVEVLSSHDGGRTLGKPVSVAKWEEYYDAKSAYRAVSGEFNCANGIPHLVAGLAVDRSAGPFRDRMYATWAECNESKKIAQVMLAFSGDSGATWSKPVRVSDAPNAFSQTRGSDPVYPTIAVTARGVVGIMWSEFHGACWRFTVSRDGGATFSPSVAVNPCAKYPWASAALYQQYISLDDCGPSDIVTRRRYNRVGFTLETDWETDGALAATSDGVFHAVWTDMADGGSLWTARIIADNQIRKTITIDGMSNVSKFVQLEVLSAHYVQSVGELVVNVVVENISEGFVPKMPPGPWRPLERLSEYKGAPQLIHAPLVLRLSSIQSELGTLKLVDPDGYDSKRAPLVDLSENIPKNGLAPHERSIPRTLVFKITKAKKGPWRLPVFASVSGEVFAQSP